MGRPGDVEHVPPLGEADQVGVGTGDAHAGIVSGGDDVPLVEQVVHAFEEDERVDANRWGAMRGDPGGGMSPGNDRATSGRSLTVRCHDHAGDEDVRVLSILRVIQHPPGTRAGGGAEQFLLAEDGARFTGWNRIGQYVERIVVPFEEPFGHPPGTVQHASGHGPGHPEANQGGNPAPGERGAGQVVRRR